MVKTKQLFKKKKYVVLILHLMIIVMRNVQVEPGIILEIKYVEILVVIHIIIMNRMIA